MTGLKDADFHNEAHLIKFVVGARGVSGLRLDRFEIGLPLFLRRDIGEFSYFLTLGIA